MNLERRNPRKLLYTPWNLVFCIFSWVSPCLEEGLAIGAQSLYIVCNDISVIVITFRKSKTHTITDTYCNLIHFFDEKKDGSENSNACIANFSVLARKSANFFANFSATKVTSLPSHSLCISLSHRAHLTHNIGSASYNHLHFSCLVAVFLSTSKKTELGACNSKFHIHNC